MNGASVHHVGYLAGDVERAAAQIGSQLGLEVTRRFERPQYSLTGVYLGVGPANIEVFSFTDQCLVEPRLGDRLLLLDHVAYAVADIRRVAARMCEQGARFTGPDGRAEITEPIDLDGVLHMWTDAGSADGLAIQLVQERPLRANLLARDTDIDDHPAPPLVGGAVRASGAGVTQQRVVARTGRGEPCGQSCSAWGTSIAPRWLA